MTDPFGTATLRAGVLAAWTSSPTRLREDANAERDLVLGGYADRLLVELAQNAADAARRAGEPGLLRLTRDGDELSIANTGAPLDSAGVAALAALRASAKTDGGVGRFGVGFAATVAVSDAPRVRSRDGGVGFSRHRTRDELAAVGREVDEPPVLRLVWPCAEPPADGFATEVRLPVRAGVDVESLLTDAVTTAPELLLALSWLRCIEVDGRVVTRVAGGGPDAGDDTVVLDVDGHRRSWRTARASGALPEPLRASLGPETRADWRVCWALPVDADDRPLPAARDVLHAPTPTAEPLTLPARLIADVAVEPSRRHVAPGPAADHVLAAAVACYPRLARGPATDRTALVPAPGFPAGALDADLRQGVTAALRTAEWLPTADGEVVAPAHARCLDVPVDAVAELLADVHPGILDAELATPTHAAALATLGVPRLRAADIVDLLGGLDRSPSWWRACYCALAELVDLDPTARDELGALPVPLADGRLVTGPRGALLGGDLASRPELVRLGAAGIGEARLVHPDAEHPLLGRLGARPVTAPELLDVLREPILRSVDDAADGLLDPADGLLDPADAAQPVPGLSALAAAVLRLAADARHEPDRGWWGALALPDVDGVVRRADELVTPEGPLRTVLAADSPLGVLHPAVVAVFGADAVAAVGVLDSFAVLDVADPVGPEHDLDAEDDWWADLDEPPARLLAVRDLDLVDPARWPAALALLASSPDTLAALTEPGGYTGWWLSRYAELGGSAPGRWRLASAVELAGLYDPAVVDLDERLLAAAGVRAGWRGLASDLGDAEVAQDLLDRLADPARITASATVSAAHTALAEHGPDPEDLDPPQRVRAMTGAVVDAGLAAVLDVPWLVAVLDPDELVACAPGGAVDLAALLDLPLASDGDAGTVVGAGVVTAWAALPEVVAVCAALGVEVPDATVLLHDDLRVRYDGVEHRVPYWVTGGVVHACDPLRALVHCAPLRPGS